MLIISKYILFKICIRISSKEQEEDAVTLIFLVQKILRKNEVSVN